MLYDWENLCCCCSVTELSLTLQPDELKHTRLLCPPLSLRVLLKFMFIESVMLSNHFILCSYPLLWPSISPSIRVFSNELALCITLPKYWSFSFSISPSNEYSGLISFRIDWFDLLAVQGTLKSLLQHQFEITNSSVLSPLYGPTLTPVHDYWKNCSFDYMKFCWQSAVSAFCMTLKTKNPFTVYIFSMEQEIWRELALGMVQH